MKYIQFGLIAVLMFSLALSPAVSGLAFAVEEPSTGPEPRNDESDKDQQASDKTETRASDKTETRDSDDKPEDRDYTTPNSEQQASDAQSEEDEPRDEADKPDDRETTTTPSSEEKVSQYECTYDSDEPSTGCPNRR